MKRIDGNKETIPGLAGISARSSGVLVLALLLLILQPLQADHGLEEDSKKKSRLEPLSLYAYRH